MTASVFTSLNPDHFPFLSFKRRITTNKKSEIAQSRSLRVNFRFKLSEYANRTKPKENRECSDSKVRLVDKNKDPE